MRCGKHAEVSGRGFRKYIPNPSSYNIGRSKQLKTIPQISAKRGSGNGALR